MFHRLVYHFISNINIKPRFLRSKPYPCVYDEWTEKVHFCDCLIHCKYKNFLLKTKSDPK